MKEIGIKLREAYSGGVERGNLILREAIKTKKINPDRLSILGLAQGIIGDSADTIRRGIKAYINNPFNVREQTVVDSSNFAAITGQILLDRVRQKYELATQIGKLIFATESTGSNLQTYREAVVSRIPEFSETVEQAMSYPARQFSQQYIDYPAPTKFGHQCNITLEAVLSDLTRQIYEMADSVGEMTGWDEERRKLRVFLGIVNNFSQNGTAANTYRTSGSWINSLSDFTLLDYRSINRLEQTLRNQTDPVTGLPLASYIKDFFVMPTQRYTAKRILNATEVRSSGTSTNDLLVSGNPIDANINMLPTSQYVQVLADAEGGFTSAQADSIVIAGDFNGAFVWREVFPVHTEQLPPNNERSFDRDIVYSVKASGMGVAGVREPRKVVFAYNSSAT